MNREEVRAALTGPVTSICLPFDNDGNIDFNGLRNQIDFDIHAGSTALILTLGNSLYTLLTDVEVEEVTKITVDHVRGRAMVVAADRTWATPKTLEFAQYAKDIGADALMVLPPNWANSCTSQTMVEHYVKVAEYIPIMVVTNVFATRGWPFAKEVFEHLIESTDGFVAVKDDLVGVFARRLELFGVNGRWRRKPYYSLDDGEMEQLADFFKGLKLL